MTARTRARFASDEDLAGRARSAADRRSGRRPPLVPPATYPFGTNATLFAGAPGGSGKFARREGACTGTGHVQRGAERAHECARRVHDGLIWDDDGAAVTNAAARSSPATRAPASGAKSSATTCSPRPSSTGSCITATSSRSTAPTASKTARRSRTEDRPCHDLHRRGPTRQVVPDPTREVVRGHLVTTNRRLAGGEQRAFLSVGGVALQAALGTGVRIGSCGASEPETWRPPPVTRCPRRKPQWHRTAMTQCNTREIYGSPCHANDACLSEPSLRFQEPHHLGRVWPPVFLFESWFASALVTGRVSL